MASRKSKRNAAPPPKPKAKARGPARSSARSTVSGPSAKAPLYADDAAARKFADTGDLAAAMPANPNKPDEYGQAARNPKPGAHHKPRDPATTGSTLSESNPSTKLGAGAPPVGHNPTNAPLDRVRVDSARSRTETSRGREPAAVITRRQTRSGPVGSRVVGPGRAVIHRGHCPASAFRAADRPSAGVKWECPHLRS